MQLSASARRIWSSRSCQDLSKSFSAADADINTTTPTAQTVALSGTINMKAQTKKQIMNLTFEISKHYRTRDGRKARCVAVDGNKADPYVFVVSGNSAFTRDATGQIGFNSSFDIVSEWNDAPEVDWALIPVWCNHVAMDADCDWYAYCKEPSIIGGAWDTKDLDPITGIPSEYAPKFSGDWKQSKVQRPSK